MQSSSSKMINGSAVPRGESKENGAYCEVRTRRGSEYKEARGASLDQAMGTKTAHELLRQERGAAPEALSSSKMLNRREQSDQ